MKRDAHQDDVSASLRTLAPARSARAAGIRIEWHGEWCGAVTAAFAAMRYDPLMDPDLVRRLWEDGTGRDRQRIALVRAPDGQAVGVVPLRKRGKLSWQLLTQYVLPYARFFVQPGYTDAALDLLGRDIDCDNVAFYETPARTRMIRAEESWVVELPTTYAELMRRTDYAHTDRRCRKRAASLAAREDCFEALPVALDYWQATWAARGSPGTAKRKDEMLLTFQALARLGRLKTFSLHDGEALAGMQINVICGDTLCCQVGLAREEYKKAYPGIWGLLASMEWACGQGFREVDMLRTSGHYKRAWAVPVVRGYRLVRRPFGSEALGCAIEGTKEFLWDLRHKDRPKS